MSRVLTTGGPGVIGSGAILRLLAAASSVWITARRDGQTIERVSFTVAHRDNGVRRVDAAAGCEFLDDRIRFESDPLS